VDRGLGIREGERPHNVALILCLLTLTVPKSREIKIVRSILLLFHLVAYPDIDTPSLSTCLSLCLSVQPQLLDVHSFLPFYQQQLQKKKGIITALCRTVVTHFQPFRSSPSPPTHSFTHIFHLSLPAWRKKENVTSLLLESEKETRASYKPPSFVEIPYLSTFTTWQQV
jgi:hypothetical protein